MNTATTARPFTELMRDVIDDIKDIVRSEIRLAKTEVREESTKAVDAAKMMAVGGLLALVAFVLMIIAAVQGLELVMPDWLAALVVGIVIGIPAAIFLVAGRERMKKVGPGNKD